MGVLLPELLDLSRADITSKRPGRRAHCLELIDQLAARIRALNEQDAKPKALPAGLGRELMTEESARTDRWLHQAAEGDPGGDGPPPHPQQPELVARRR